jgi:hypothetical protein
MPRPIVLLGLLGLLGLAVVVAVLVFAWKRTRR